MYLVPSHYVHVHSKAYLLPLAMQFCPICEDFLCGTIVLVDKRDLYHIGMQLHGSSPSLLVTRMDDFGQIVSFAPNVARALTSITGSTMAKYCAWITTWRLRAMFVESVRISFGCAHFKFLLTLRRLIITHAVPNTGSCRTRSTEAMARGLFRLCHLLCAFRGFLLHARQQALL